METRKIVVAYDFSESADLALERAIELVCRAPNHIPHFIAVIDPHHGLGIEPDETVDYRYAERVGQTLGSRLDAIFAERRPELDTDYFVHARIGEAAAEILGLAAEIGADLVIIGSHGRTGVRRLLLGSVSETVVRRALCPVIVARAKSYPDVELPKVVDANPEQHTRYVQPHRYSYTSRAVTLPPESPIN